MNSWIDLTKRLDEQLEIYHDEQYTDPLLRVSQWTTIKEQQFNVSKLELGTQTGTHIDAPSHFYDKGATLDKLDSNELIGTYQLIDTRKSSFNVPDIKKEKILFILGSTSLSNHQFSQLLNLNFKVWVVCGVINIHEKKGYYFHQTLAKKGIYLVEDLDESKKDLIPNHGEIMAIPLHLIGTSGSPCRVLARPSKQHYQI